MLIVKLKLTRLLIFPNEKMNLTCVEFFFLFILPQTIFFMIETTLKVSWGGKNCIIFPVTPNKDTPKMMLKHVVMTQKRWENVGWIAFHFLRSLKTFFLDNTNEFLQLKTWKRTFRDFFYCSNASLTNIRFSSRQF